MGLVDLVSNSDEDSIKQPEKRRKLCMDTDEYVKESKRLLEDIKLHFMGQELDSVQMDLRKRVEEMVNAQISNNRQSSNDVSLSQRDYFSNDGITRNYVENGSMRLEPMGNVRSDFLEASSRVDEDLQIVNRIMEQHGNLDLSDNDDFEEMKPTCSMYEKENFSWSAKLRQELHDLGLKEFRQYQLPSCNSILDGKDTFVIMPTGGGKSLCYQLPGMISEGLSFIISPLLSLIDDQIRSLAIRYDVEAVSLTGETSQREMKEVIEKIRNGSSKLIYTTPEKCTKSKKVINLMQKLYQNGVLDRIIIDEAHCISTWGHDFRPAYQELSQLRLTYPMVPIMALTATASERVQKDIIKSLKLRNPVLVKGSFNRPNLFYRVIPKKSTVIQNMIQIIREHSDEVGIIYCLSTNDVESISSKLQNEGIPCTKYYSSCEQKTKNFKEWSREKVKLMIATIAFGMGIDKPNVRYVIHHSMPKSIESLYQESGRAGRDGLNSTTVVFFGRNDRNRYLRLASRSKSLKAKDKESLDEIVSYCENVTDCRRVIQLQHFGEPFDRANCNNMCDNCQLRGNVKTIEVTDHAKNIASLLNSVKDSKLTSLQIVNIYRGSKVKAIKDKYQNLPQYGQGKSLSKDETLQLMQQLLTKRILTERRVKTQYGGHSILCLSPLAYQLVSGRLNMKFELSIREKAKGKKISSTGQDKMTKKLLTSLKKWRSKVSKVKELEDPTHLIDDKILLNLAKGKPSTLEALKKLEISTNVLKNYAVDLINLIRKFLRNHMEMSIDDLTLIEVDQINKSFKPARRNLVKPIEALKVVDLADSDEESSQNIHPIPDLLVGKKKPSISLKVPKPAVEEVKPLHTSDSDSDGFI